MRVRVFRRNSGSNMSIKCGFSEVTFKKKQVGVDVTVEQRT